MESLSPMICFKFSCQFLQFFDLGSKNRFWLCWRTLQVTGFQLRLKHEKLPLPRCGDVVIMDFPMMWGLDYGDLLSISRVKEKL